MKKVMMFVAVMVCAVSVQAASIIWGNDLYPLYDVNGTILSSLSGITVNLVNEDTGGVLGSATGIGMTPGVLMGTGANYVFGTQGTTGDLIAIEMHAMFVVGGDTLEYTRTISNSAWEISAKDGTGNDTFLWSGPGFNDTGWVLIPEPTAMALLALGAAAFGLRRRFRR